MEKKAMQLEHDMWEAALHRDVDAFKSFVSPTAVMICGGYRCLGSEYAGILENFYISGYSISDMEVVSSSDDEVVLHYILRVNMENARDKDLEGLFHIVSIWKKSGDTWQLILNMDSRIVEQ